MESNLCRIKAFMLSSIHIYVFIKYVCMCSFHVFHLCVRIRYFCVFVFILFLQREMLFHIIIITNYCYCVYHHCCNYHYNYQHHRYHYGLRNYYYKYHHISYITEITQHKYSEMCKPAAFCKQVHPSKSLILSVLR